MIIRKDQVINLCEMKYTENEYVVDKDFDKAMRRKVSDFIKSTQTKYTIHTTLVSANEVIDNSYAGNLQSIITAEDLFVN